MEPLAARSTPSHPKFVRWAVVLALIVVLNILFIVIRAIVFPTPLYETYCPASLTNQPSPATQSECVAQGGTWNFEGVVPAPPPDAKATVPSGYCDFTSKCNTQFEAAQKTYEEKAFALMTALGVIAIVVGILPIGSSIVSSGLSYGGVLALIIGSGLYWNEAGNWLRLAIALIALAVLIYIGLKRFRD